MEVTIATLSMFKKIIANQQGETLTEESNQKIQAVLLKHKIDAVLIVPPDFSLSGSDEPARTNHPVENESSPNGSAASLALVLCSSSEKSVVAAERVKMVLRRWKEGLIANNLDAAGISRFDD